jgi:hypothetical protein
MDIFHNPKLSKKCVAVGLSQKTYITPMVYRLLTTIVVLFWCATCWSQVNVAAVDVDTSTNQNEFYDIQPLNSSTMLVIGVRSPDAPTVSKAMRSANPKFTMFNFLAEVNHKGKVQREIDLPIGTTNTILSTVVVSEDHIFVAGRTRQGRSDYLLLAGFDKQYNLLWIDSMKHHGIIYEMKLTNDGKLIACGLFNHQIVVCNLDTDGTWNWYKTYASDKDGGWNEAFGVEVTSDAYFVAGSIANQRQENYGILAINPAGEKLFEKTYSPERSEASAIAACGNNYVVAGQYSCYQKNGYLLKITPKGDTIFTTLFEGSDFNLNTVRSLTKEQRADSSYMSTLGKGLEVKPWDMLALPNEEVLVLCNVSYYVQPLYSQYKAQTIGLFHFSSTGKLIKRSVLKHGSKFSAKALIKTSDNNYLVVVNQKKPKKGLILSVNLKDLFD